jgi:hypothetical protein
MNPSSGAIPFRAPTGAAAPDAPPDSMLAQMRAISERRREQAELTLIIPGWEDRLRVTYGYVDLDTLEGYSNVDLTHASGVSLSLDMLAKATIRVEGLNATTGEWETFRDQQGPVPFDDRFARLLGWPRPDPDFEFAVRQVYEGVFAGNGLAIATHAAEVSTWMGVVVEEEETGKDSTNTGSTSSPTASSSE